MSRSPGYVFVGIPTPWKFKSLTESASELGISTKRLSRTLKTLAIPVIEFGNQIMIDEKSLNRVRAAMARNEIRRGRKKKEQTDHSTCS